MVFTNGSVPWNKGIQLSEEQKRKIGLIHKGKIISDETKRKMSLAKQGIKHPMFGKKRPDISLLCKNRVWSDKSKAKISTSNKGRKWSDESRVNVSGINSPMYGKNGSLSYTFGRKHTDVEKQKMSKNHPDVSGTKNPMFGKPSALRAGIGKVGFREDIGHFVRSTWEANFARILKYKGRNYLYEPQTFLLTLDDDTEVSYTPDFMLEGDVYI